MHFEALCLLSSLGVDVAETALAIAREKAHDRGIEVEFAAADAFQLDRLGRTFTTVLDCGLFHTFDADERTRYVASLASVTQHGGTLYVLCFSDDGPDTGPHAISHGGRIWMKLAVRVDLRTQSSARNDSVRFCAESLENRL